MILNNNMKFDDLTEYTKNAEGFYPKKLIEEGMEKKLQNLKKVHEKGYDGTGVGIAIIDNTLLGDHLEIKNNLSFINHILMKMRLQVCMVSQWRPSQLGKM